jgi:hypothetical protein
VLLKSRVPLATSCCGAIVLFALVTELLELQAANAINGTNLSNFMTFILYKGTNHLQNYRTICTLLLIIVQEFFCFRESEPSNNLRETERKWSQHPHIS